MAPIGYQTIYFTYDEYNFIENKNIFQFDLFSTCLFGMRKREYGELVLVFGQINTNEPTRTTSKVT